MGCLVVENMAVSSHTSHAILRSNALIQSNHMLNIKM